MKLEMSSCSKWTARIGTGCAALLISTAAFATPITTPFVLEFYDEDDVFIGEGTGTFTYDSDDITGIGEESLNGYDDITLTVTVDGATYYGYQDRDNNPSGNGEYPIVGFDDGILDNFNFILKDGKNGVSFSGSLSGYLEFDMDDVTYSEGVYTVVGSVSVPEPGTLGLLCLGLMGLGLVRRKSI